MRMRSGRALGWGSVAVSLLGVMSVGCSDDDAVHAPTDFERGTKTAIRWDACHIEPLEPLTMEDHLGIIATTQASLYSDGFDCVNAASDCDGVDACRRKFSGDNQIDQLPPCGSVPTDHCAGNVAKNCQDPGDGVLYEVSYDCSLAHATCVEGTRKDGHPWADCKASEAPCAGHESSYCDGSRVVICENIWDSVLSPAVYDCADAFGSTCAQEDEGETPECEGPVVGEIQCHDGKDNDGDGNADCYDNDCHCDP